MKIFSAAILLCTLLLNGTTHAEESSYFSNPKFEKVTTASLKILGRGVHDRRTNAGLTLACVGTSPDSTEPQCTELRWVLYTGKESYFIGTKLSVSGENDRESKKKLKAYLKSLSKNAKRETRNASLALGAGGVVLTSVIVIAETVALTQPMVVVLVGAWGLVVCTLDKTSRGINTFNGNPSYQAINANSWNWSIDSKAVNHNYFRALFWNAAGLTGSLTGGWPYFGRTRLDNGPLWLDMEFEKEHSEIKDIFTNLRLK